MHAFDVAPASWRPNDNSMPIWRGFTDWTPPEKVVDLVTASLPASSTPGRAACSPRWWTTSTRSAARRRTTPSGGLRLRPYKEGDDLANR